MNPATTIATTSSGISTTQFLVVLALMLILMVAGLAGLTQRRSRRLTSWHWLDRLSDLVLSKDPKQTVLLLRYLVGAANSVAGIAALNYGVSEKVIEADGSSWLTATAIFCALGFYAVMRMGFNQRFADPSMAAPQIICAVLFLAWGYTLGGPGSPIALLLLFVFLMFSIFTSTTRTLIQACLVAAVAFGVAMTHVAQSTPQVPYMAKLQLVYFCVMLFMLVSVCVLVSQFNRMRDKSTRRKQELSEALARIQDLATRDELTGLFNRRHMLELLNNEKHRSIRSERRFCIALIDVDRFKSVNDTHGHGVGDEVLASVAGVITGGLRETDVVARWGGEEFLVMFTDTDCPTAELVLSRIQMMLSATMVSQAVPSLHVTFSAGLTHYDAEEMLTRTIDRADRGLYMAKAGGRNRVVRLEPGQPEVATPAAAPAGKPTTMSSVALENRHAFDVGGMGKHVHRPA
ncbi:MAG: GGDEF domain-containing protein [Aquabacterium sp.]|uniref:diguanylate cyclase n=1 Tax=Aquabacterium sp. TaxID=1872578 RepID=UPI0025BC00D1|nr:diguanylate cyclase [Aquabacterium sp.]MBI3380714.1 GGDEF domain-containing protein [Aquabacterium sp.]